MAGAADETYTLLAFKLPHWLGPPAFSMPLLKVARPQAGQHHSFLSCRQSASLNTLPVVGNRRIYATPVSHEIPPSGTSGNRRRLNLPFSSSSLPHPAHFVCIYYSLTLLFLQPPHSRLGRTSKSSPLRSCFLHCCICSSPRLRSEPRRGRATETAHVLRPAARPMRDLAPDLVNSLSQLRRRGRDVGFVLWREKSSFDGAAAKNVVAAHRFGCFGGIVSLVLIFPLPPYILEPHATVSHRMWRVGGSMVYEKPSLPAKSCQPLTQDRHNPAYKPEAYTSGKT
ncbi:uncharacterized protein IWZ02DRAFT_77003 [Phyllosticta citriasiana]|uniref:uncharacterized protein n=1 Tax=Phyllosticta citriasiana TaxID=595635 RepID=UPI0030FDD2D7